MTEIRLQRIPHGFALKLQAVYQRLSRAEKRAADYLVAHPQEIHALSIVTLARRAGCSEATVVRLSKHVGYEGYPELKAQFRPGANGQELFEYRGLRPDDEPDAVMKKIFDAAAQAICDTSTVIDPVAYRAALKALCRASAILFCGVGNAAVVAQEAYLSFIRIGFPASFATDRDLQLVLASQLGPKDVLLAVSHSGQTKTLLDVAKEARRAGATVIAVTNYPFSALAQEATHILQTAVFTSYISGEIMSKRVAELCIVESLFVNFIMRRKGPYTARLAASNEVLKVNKL